jgi:hypothetical protein
MHKVLDLINDFLGASKVEDNAFLSVLNEKYLTIKCI